MPPEPTVARVERDLIVPLRTAVLSGPDRRVTSLSGDLAPTTRHWAVWRGDTVIACASVMKLRGWALRGMAVDPRYQRQGIGTLLLQTLCGQVAQPMWCNARSAAVPFYAAMGWQAVGPVFQLQEHGDHQRMTWSPKDPAPPTS